MSIKVEIDYDAADTILVEALKEQYYTLKMERPGGIFYMDKKKDKVALKELLKSFENVLRYNMVDSDFVAFKKEIK